jgi:dienelactone hydrolase
MRLLSLLFIIPISIACNTAQQKETKAIPKLKEAAVTYTGDSVTMNGFVVYDENISGARPAVLVIHEWWGHNDYARMRARKLAELGYIAMAVDMYGNGKTADNPDSAGALAMPFYAKPAMAKTRFDAALAQLKTYAQTDSNKVAAIGYCFGGAQALNIARLGNDLKGVVSFHGNLVGAPLKKELLKAQVLVCHGADDQFIQPAEIALFKKQMDSIGANYTFKSYAGSTHAFTNPAATEMGKKFNLPIAYNAVADSISWIDMKDFFQKIFK